MSSVAIPYHELGAPISPPAEASAPDFAGREIITARAESCRGCPSYRPPASRCGACLGVCTEVDPPAQPVVTLLSTTCPRKRWTP